MNAPAASRALRVLICDDEPLARLRLRQLVGDCRDPAAEVAGEVGDAQAALQWLAASSCDVLLLDIHMPGLDGLQLAQQLRALESTPLPAPALVFVTAHAEHALRAFELEATDYLTKPVKRERLQAALQRVAKRLPAAAAAAAATAGEADEPLVIVVTERGRVRRVPVAEVLYLKAELKYVTLRTAEHSFVLDDSLAELEQRLGDRFLRVHRNALVAKAAVQALERRAVDGDDEGGEGWAVCVAPVGEWLAVSRRQAAAVRDALVHAGRG